MPQYRGDERPSPDGGGRSGILGNPNPLFSGTTSTIAEAINDHGAVIRHDRSTTRSTSRAAKRAAPCLWPANCEPALLIRGMDIATLWAADFRWRGGLAVTMRVWLGMPTDLSAAVALGESPMSIRPSAVTAGKYQTTPSEERSRLMDRKLIPFLAFTLLVAASGCSQQAAPLRQVPVQATPLPPAAPAHQPAMGNPCLPPGPCNYPHGGDGGSISY